MKRTAFILAALLATACAHASTKTPEMLQYEELRDSDYAELVREREPNAFDAAQKYYGESLVAYQDKDEPLAHHYAQLALMTWRQAGTRSRISDAGETQVTAKAQLDEATALLEARAEEELKAQAGLARLQKITELQAKLAAAEQPAAAQEASAAATKAQAGARSSVEELLSLLKDAEIHDADKHAQDLLNQARAKALEGSDALAAGNLSAAKARAAEGKKLAAKALVLAKKGQEVEKARLSRELRKQDLYAATSKLGRVDRRVTDRGVVVTMNDMFASGEFEVVEHRRGAVEELGRIATTFPEFSIIIEAHTDNRGGKTQNLSLSQARAQAVLSELTRLQVDPSRISSIGVGDARPVADNRRKDGRAKNRRIEVVFVPPRAP